MKQADSTLHSGPPTKKQRILSNFLFVILTVFFTVALMSIVFAVLLGVRK